MTAKAGTKDKSLHRDRRSGVDRRKVDGAPPGKPERRRNVESRQPDVVEIDMSTSEWAALDHESPPAKK